MHRLNDLTIPPGNRLERLHGKRSGQHSIRINDQYRICFRWEAEYAHEVEITDEIIRGKRAVTPDTALRLARVLGMSADFWLGLQLDWDLWHAIRNEKTIEIDLLEPLLQP